MIKICNGCKLEKALESFPKQKRGLHGRESKCWTCRNARSKEIYDPERERVNYLRYTYQLTPEQYGAMVAAQGGCCNICKKPTAKLFVDHDHTCCPSNRKTCGKCIRGLLCHKCNVGLGKFKESEMSLLSVLEYLA